MGADTGMGVAILVQEHPEKAMGHVLSDDEGSCWGPLISSPALEEGLLMDFWRTDSCSTRKNVQVSF